MQEVKNKKRISSTHFHGTECHYVKLLLSTVTALCSCQCWPWCADVRRTCMGWNNTWDNSFQTFWSTSLQKVQNPNHVNAKSDNCPNSKS